RVIAHGTSSSSESSSAVAAGAGAAAIQGASSPRCDDGLFLDRTEIYVGEGRSQTIRVSWRFDASSVNLMDWIGLFDESEHASTKFIDYKLVGSASGTLLWNLTTVHLEKSSGPNFVFRYYDGLTGLTRARSHALHASTVPRVRITDITCTGLPSTHKPLRVTLAAGSSNLASLTSPSGNWKHLELDLPSGCSDLRFRVSEQQLQPSDRRSRADPSSASNSLIEGAVPVADFLAAAKQDLSVAIRTPLAQRRLYANQRLSLLVHFRILPERVAPKTPRSSPPISPIAASPADHHHQQPRSPSAAPSCSSSSSLSSMHSSIASSSSSSSGSASSSGISSGSNQSALSLIRARLDAPLPDGWECRVDWHGRIFYIDHRKKKTSWRRPEMPSESEEESSVKRPDVTSTPSKIYHPSRRTINSATTSDEPIAMRFLKREDFMVLLHANQTALRLYHASRVVKHIVHRIRKNDTISLALFEQSSDFVRFVNLFADSTQRLPENWQSVGGSPTVFINHSLRSTTLLDPRLPLLSSLTTRQQRRTRSAPPRQKDGIRDLNGNSLLSTRTDEIASAVERRRPELASRLRRKLRILERWGDAGLARLVNDIDVATALSLLETGDDNGKGPSTSSSSNMARSEQEEIDEKVAHFYQSLQRSGYGAGPSKLRLRFSRESLLHDAFDQILAADVNQLRRAKLTIAFDDEDGLDYGGPSRELFFLLSRELFNPYYGLFEYTAPDRYIVAISPMSAFVDNNQSWMELAGRVLGLALVHRCLIDTFFTRTFYKMLLELPITLEDLESVDPEFCRSLKWIRENKISDEDGFFFSVTQEIAGEVTEKELLPNGKELAVTDSNKEEFIQLMLRWRVDRGIQPQSRALLRGLHQIIDRDFLRVFSVEQLELVLAGSVEVDLDDWQNWTEYKGGYGEHHVVIRWFWDTVEEMSNEDRLKLLQFVTGTASVPYEGFRALRGSTGLKKFTIERWGESFSLPRAHTCFNRLDLPSYPSRKTLREKLIMALNEGIAYAIE
ncbi:hypothetical protein PENTCL1PPCAC_12798, partial [Pristionchus entomophagus]